MSASLLRPALLTIALAGLTMAGCGQDAAPKEMAGADTPTVSDPAPPPAPPPVATNPTPQNATSAPTKTGQPAVPVTHVRVGPKGEAVAMPAASAGTNGSFVPRPDSERRTIIPHTHAADGPDSTERTAVLLGGTALAPPGAPDAIKGAISSANLLVGQPYKWGGGHSSWSSIGYDCSGAVSYALAGGGLLNAPLTSSQLASWGVPGPGRWLTIYANPRHAYAVIAGLRWDTVGDARGSGPRWHPVDPYPHGFQIRHLPGL
jgi:cell wall-associated NlpC family hydrolase